MLKNIYVLRGCCRDVTMCYFMRYRSENKKNQPATIRGPAMRLINRGVDYLLALIVTARSSETYSLPSPKRLASLVVTSS